MVNKQLKIPPSILYGEEQRSRFLTNDWTVSFFLFLLAFLIRIPYLYDVPRFIDEWREIELSVEIARGEAWPLHNTSHDIGPFHNYVLAGLFSLFGFNVYLPRLYVAVTSAATVVVTYWIARHWSGKVAAIIAALLLATNSMHILVTHMAWSNDTTPFFVGAAVLLSLKALIKENHAIWAWTGLAWAIALQTHPSVIAALLGVMVYLGRQLSWSAYWRESRIWIAIATFIAGYSNMIIHNIIKPWDSILWVKRKEYALNQEWSAQAYFDNMMEMGSELVHALASAFPDGKGGLHSVSVFLMFFFIFGLLDGFRRLARFRHGGFLGAMVISSFLIIPLLNDQYKFYIWTRYIAFLFPLCFVAAAIGFQSWISFLMAQGWGLKLKSGLVVAWSLILILPLLHFYSYAEAYIQSGQDNSAEFLAIQAIQTDPDHHTTIAVDKQAKQAEAVSKMFRVKGFRSPLVGVDPNEVHEVQTVPLNLKKGIDTFFYNKWKRALAKHKPQTLYVLSLENKEKITLLFDITWADEKVIVGHSGNEVYFIGRVAPYKEE